MDLNKLLEQAKSMQTKMQEKQKDIEKEEVKGTSGGGLVNITLNGAGGAIAVAIDDSLIKVEEKEILEDLIIAALNDAQKKVESLKSHLTTDMVKNMGLNMKDFGL